VNEDMHHPEPEALEALAAGSLPAADRATVASHVETCGPCGAEVEEFRLLFAALADLPRLAPSTAFADRVMARVRVAPVPAVVPDGVPFADRLRALVPGKRLRWALAATFTGLPVVTVGAALAWLVTHPNLSAQALWIFATQRVESAIAVAAPWIMEQLAATRAAGWLGAFGRGLATIDPGRLGVAASVLLVLTGVSAWVLYSNLIRTPTRERHHVSYSF
jgi:anti-sigma factor RsiW